MPDCVLFRPCPCAQALAKQAMKSRDFSFKAIAKVLDVRTLRLRRLRHFSKLGVHPDPMGHHSGCALPHEQDSEKCAPGGRRSRVWHGAGLKKPCALRALIQEAWTTLESKCGRGPGSLRVRTQDRLKRDARNAVPICMRSMEWICSERIRMYGLH